MNANEASYRKNPEGGSQKDDRTKCEKNDGGRQK